MSWVDPPVDYDPHSLAEYIECVLFLSEDDYLSLTEIRGMFTVGSQPTDEDLTFAFAEIERRGREFGVMYPSLVDDRGVLIDRGERSNLYGLLLLLSLKGTEFRQAKDYRRSDPLFDAVVREAFRSEQGENARAIVFAWPPRGDRPSAFPEAVGWAARKMGVSLRADNAIPDHYQDAGVDVIVWRPFPDGRNGFQILLVQNTVQREFRKKPRDVVPTQWHGWLKIGVIPSVGFAIPFSTPTGDIWWHDVTNETAIVMDRGRLLYSLRVEDPSRWPEWPEIVQFVQGQLDEARSPSVSPSSALQVARPRRKSSTERKSSH